MQATIAELVVGMQALTKAQAQRPKGAMVKEKQEKERIKLRPRKQPIRQTGRDEVDKENE